MSAPVRARKVRRAQDSTAAREAPSSDRRAQVAAFYLVPPVIAGSVALGIFLWHITFGAGIVGLIAFGFSSLMAVVFSVVAAVDWLRSRRR